MTGDKPIMTEASEALFNFVALDQGMDSETWPECVEQARQAVKRLDDLPAALDKMKARDLGGGCSNYRLGFQSGRNSTLETIKKLLCGEVGK